MSIRTIDTTTRSRKWERNHPEPLGRFTIAEIAKEAKRSKEAVALLIRASESKFRAAWALWETVDFDESRRGEIARELDRIESLTVREAA